MTENCINCIYSKDGKCKRFPPKPIQVRYYNGSGEYNFAVESLQPDVYEDDWCGEFKSKYVGL